MATKPEWITEVTFYATDNGGNNRAPEARGSFTIADVMFVRFSLFKGEDGQYRISLPATVNARYDANQPSSKTNKKYFDEVGPVSLEVRNELINYLVDKLLQERTGGTATPRGRVSPTVPF